MYKVLGQQSLPLSKNRREALWTMKGGERILLALERKCDTKQLPTRAQNWSVLHNL